MRLNVSGPLPGDPYNSRRRGGRPLDDEPTETGLEEEVTDVGQRDHLDSSDPKLREAIRRLSRGGRRANVDETLIGGSLLPMSEGDTGGSLASVFQSAFSAERVAPTDGLPGRQLTGKEGAPKEEVRRAAPPPPVPSQRRHTPVPEPALHSEVFDFHLEPDEPPSPQIEPRSMSYGSFDELSPLTEGLGPVEEFTISGAAPPELMRLREAMAGHVEDNPDDEETVSLKINESDELRRMILAASGEPPPPHQSGPGRRLTQLGGENLQRLDALPRIEDAPPEHEETIGGILELLDQTSDLQMPGDVVSRPQRAPRAPRLERPQRAPSGRGTARGTAQQRPHRPRPTPEPAPARRSLPEPTGPNSLRPYRPASSPGPELSHDQERLRAALSGITNAEETSWLSVEDSQELARQELSAPQPPAPTPAPPAHQEIPTRKVPRRQEQPRRAQSYSPPKLSEEVTLPSGGRELDDDPTLPNPQDQERPVAPAPAPKPPPKKDPAPRLSAPKRAPPPRGASVPRAKKDIGPPPVAVAPPSARGGGEMFKEPVLAWIASLVGLIAFGGLFVVVLLLILYLV